MMLVSRKETWNTELESPTLESVEHGLATITAISVDLKLQLHQQKIFLDFIGHHNAFTLRGSPKNSIIGIVVCLKHQLGA